MDNFYFEVVHRVEKFFGTSIFPLKVRIWLLMLYFPVIGSFVLYFTLSAPQWFTIVFLIAYLAFSPLLLIPGVYNLRGLNYIVVYQLKKLLDENPEKIVIESYSDTLSRAVIENCNEKYHIPALRSDLATEYPNKYEVIKSVDHPDYVRHNRIYTLVTEKHIQRFIDNEASDYFETIDTTPLRFLLLLYAQGRKKESWKIKLYDDLSTYEIKTVVKRLSEITKIPMREVCKVFLRFEKRSGRYVHLNWNSIKSSVSQNFK